MRPWRWPGWTLQRRLCGSSLKGTTNQRARFEQFCGMWRSAGAAILSLPLASEQRASIRIGFLEAGVEEIVLPFKVGVETPGLSGRSWVFASVIVCHLLWTSSHTFLHSFVQRARCFLQVANWKQAQTPIWMKAEIHLRLCTSSLCSSCHATSKWLPTISKHDFTNKMVGLPLQVVSSYVKMYCKCFCWI